MIKNKAIHCVGFRYSPSRGIASKVTNMGLVFTIAIALDASSYFKAKNIKLMPIPRDNPEHRHIRIIFGVAREGMPVTNKITIA